MEDTTSQFSIPPDNYIITINATTFDYNNFTKVIYDFNASF